MCGFLVHYKFNENSFFSKENFIKSAKLLKHRGPDDNYQIFDKKISMIFYRLSIMDQSKKGRQPMFSFSKRYLMVFNGEIYNAKELKKKIPSSIKLKSSSDSEVLINLYELYGYKFLKFIKGMFSIVIYDRKSKKLFTARDRFGIKPLYYLKDQDKIVISSEIKPLLYYSKYPQFSLNTFSKFFFKQELDSTNTTFFENIKIHEPSMYKLFYKKLLCSKVYWKIEKNKKFFDNNSKTKNIRLLSNFLKNSVTEHLNSDVKIALLLSGGLDSSIIGELIKNNYSKKIETFTYDFIGNDIGESIKAHEISNYLGYKNHNIIVKPDYILKNFEKICLELESPFTSIRLFGLRKLYQNINKEGYKVALEGSGGDELLVGYEYNYLSNILDLHSRKKTKILKYFRSLSKEKLLNSIITLSYQNGSTKDASPFINLNLFNRDF